MDDGVGALAQGGERFGPVERALDPVDAVGGRPPAAGERADRMTRRAGGAEQMPADEAGAAGDGEGGEGDGFGHDDPPLKEGQSLFTK